MVGKSLLFCLFFSVIYGQKRSPVGQRVEEHQHSHPHQHSYSPVETQVIEYEVPCPPPQPYPEYETPAPKGPQATEQAVYYSPIDSYPQSKPQYESKYAQYKKYYNQQYIKKAEPVYAPAEYQQYQTSYAYPQQQPAAPQVCAEEPKQPETPNKKSPSIQIFLV